jgi:hypothetical protein
VPKKRKPATKLTDKELVRRVIPTEIRNQLKKLLVELNAEKPKPKKSKSR